jgi:hypothetical protein
MIVSCLNYPLLCAFNKGGMIFDRQPHSGLRHVNDVTQLAYWCVSLDITLHTSARMRQIDACVGRIALIGLFLRH